MATEFCQKCKKAHPGRTCDYDEHGECSETAQNDSTDLEPSEETKLPEKNGN